jgi:hypothetical protein
LHLRAVGRTIGGSLPEIVHARPAKGARMPPIDPETGTETETLLRAYAAGELAWSTLRERGFDSYADVLAGLGRLGLRPPLAAMEGPNVASRTRGRALIREALGTGR